MEFLTALRDIPLPTILVILGSFFLLLAVVSRIGTYVSLSPKQQRWAAVIGGVLLILGIILHLLHLVPSQSPPPTPTPTLPPAPTDMGEIATFTPSPTDVPRSTPTPIFTSIPIPSPTPTPECRFDNLLNCSSEILPVYIEGQSSVKIALTLDGLEVDFSNDMQGSGVAFLFRPALDVRGFSHLDISGFSTQDFSFYVEYKVGNPPTIVVGSGQQLFHRASNTIQVPLEYDGTVNEIILNFSVIGESSFLTITSIRLAQ